MSLLKNSIHFIMVVLLSATLSCKDKKEVDVAVETKSYIELPAPEQWRDDWSKEPVVVVHELAEPDNLHPANGNSQTRAELFLYLHAGLLRVDLRTGTIQPGICKGMPELSSDQREMIFELREDVKWDDGSAVSPEDVIFTMKAAKNPLTNNPGFKPYFDLVEEVKRVEGASNKVMIKMKKVYVQNLALWSDYPIIQRAFFDPENVLANVSFAQLNDSSFQAQSNKALVDWSASFNAAENGFDPKRISGLGPYKVAAWNQGQSIELQKKKQHWTNNVDAYEIKSEPEKIIFKVNTDAVTQELAFLKQEFDASTSLSARTLLKLKEDSLFNLNYHSRFVDIFGYTFVGINMKPDEKKRAVALKNIDVRKALALLTPVDEIIKVVNKGVNKRVTGPVARMKASYNHSLQLIPLDIVQASTLLDKAGWLMDEETGIRYTLRDGKKQFLELELMFLATVPEWKEMAMMIAESMKKAGVLLKLNAVDLNGWLEKGCSHDFDLIMGSWNSSSLPEDYSQLWSTQSWNSQGLNLTGFGNETSDRIIDSIAVTLNDSLRNALEFRLQKLIDEEQPYVFLYGLVRRTAVHRRFTHAELYAERPGILYNLLKASPMVGVKVDATP